MEVGISSLFIMSRQCQHLVARGMLTYYVLVTKVTAKIDLVDTVSMVLKNDCFKLFFFSPLSGSVAVMAEGQ